jgi:1H-pyrrole-2-carbonyl-[peptidyl-carrier protein] chlorinase
MTHPDFDVGIIGGGPAGSAMATYLAGAGVRCVIFEREIFPRPHVGESLVPSSTRVFKDLGLLAKLEEAKFPRKYGAAWTASAAPPPSSRPAPSSRSGSGPTSAPISGPTSAPISSHKLGFDGLQPDCDARIRFDERAQPGVDMNYTFHVDRGKFDLLLLQHANERGAAVYEGIRVDGVDFDAAPFPEVQFTMGRRAMRTSVRMVIDASGRHTILGNQLKLKVRDPVFDQYAIHSWFEGYDRRAVAGADQMADYIFIHFLPVSNTWLWQIPISDAVTSIGVVTQKRNFAKTKDSRERFFWDTIGSRPELHDALKKASQVRPFKDEGDYSYAMTQICGDRFLLIGDAARFVDPIFSTGVSIALNSARLATPDVLAALEAGRFGRESFSTYETTIRRGTKNWYEFISVYYRLNVLFTYFVSTPKYRLDVLKLLQGDVYDEDEPAVLTKMREIVSIVEKNERHMWHDKLNDLTSKAFQPAY